MKQALKKSSFFTQTRMIIFLMQFSRKSGTGYTTIKNKKINV